MEVPFNYKHCGLPDGVTVEQIIVESAVEDFSKQIGFLFEKLLQDVSKAGGYHVPIDDRARNVLNSESATVSQMLNQCRRLVVDYCKPEIERKAKLDLATTMLELMSKKNGS